MIILLNEILWGLPHLRLPNLVITTFSFRFDRLNVSLIIIKKKYAFACNWLSGDFS